MGGGEGMEIYYKESYKGPAGGRQPGDPGEPLFQFNPQSHLFQNQKEPVLPTSFKGNLLENSCF